jgi:hypothetical protein
MRKILVRDPVKRLTAQAALHHKWFRLDQEDLAKRDLGEAQERLRTLRARRR